MSDEDIRRFVDAACKPGTVIFAHPDTAYKLNREFFKAKLADKLFCQSIQHVPRDKVYVMDPEACSLRTTTPPPS